jgi:hypothetical protein
MQMLGALQAMSTFEPMCWPSKCDTCALHASHVSLGNGHIIYVLI